MLPYEIMIGLRYTRAGRAARSQRRLAGGAGRSRRNRFISFISGLATAGIALGVAALIVVLSVMNGFQKEVRDRMLSVLSHAEVMIPGVISRWLIACSPRWQDILQCGLLPPS